MEYGKEYFDYCKDDNHFDMNVCAGWQMEYVSFLKRVFPGFVNSTTKSIDIGAGTGSIPEACRRQYIEMYGCDVSQWYIENTKFPLIREKLGVIVDNQIPFGDKMFDFAHMSQVVEHIPEAAIREELVDVLRIMKDSGILFISTVGEGPAIPPPGEDPTHISCFSQEKWEGIFKDCGFENVTSDYLDKIRKDPFAGRYDWVVFVLKKGK